MDFESETDLELEDKETLLAEAEPEAEIKPEAEIEPEAEEEPEAETEVEAEPEVEIKEEEKTSIDEASTSKVEAPGFDFLAFNQGPLPDDNTLDELLMNVWHSEADSKNPMKHK